MSNDRTELENCVLAVIGRDGPCSRYHVMQVFAASQTSRWSSTAGSIYPLLARLEKAGFVCRSESAAKRGAQFALTRAGERAVVDWLSADAEPVAGPNDDPIRTRATFIDRLSPEEQKIAVRGWRDSTRREVEAAERQRAIHAAAGEYLLERAFDATERQLRARLAWLEERFD